MNIRSSNPRRLARALVLASVLASMAFGAPGLQVASAAATACVKPGAASPCNYSSIQAAIDAVGADGTVYVYPGAYSETATGRYVLNTNGPHQFGLFISENNVSVIGVDGGGNPITDFNNIDIPSVTTNATNNFGYSGIFVQGDGVTISGLKILPNVSGDNKTIEVIGDNFTIKHSHFDIPGGGSIYFNDWRFVAGDPGSSYLQRYTVEANGFDYGTSVDVASGAGYSGPVEWRVIKDNKFTGDGANTTTWALISFSGSGGVPWFVDPVGGAVITGNHFSGAAQYIRARGTYLDQFDWASYWSDNEFDKAVIVGVNPPADVRNYSYTSGSYTFTNVRRIGAVIQGEVDHALAGDTVLIAAGTYVENVVVNRSVTMAGAGQSATIVQPATTGLLCDYASICPGASIVISVQANDVTIRDLTVDGDNPNLVSEMRVGGADLNARDGIITNHTVGTFTNLEIYNVTVKNIYLRGIQASTGSTFNIHDNTVENVQGEYASIAIFNSGGAGTFANNSVAYANDAISANHSRGTQFLDNTITNSGSGIHTDNAGDGGGVPDLIQGNTVSDCTPDGYGVWVFVPYLAPSVIGNTVNDCSVGLSAWGQGAEVTPLFTNNVVDGPTKAPGSVGVYITTDWISYGYSDISVSLSGNIITDNETGIQLTADQAAWNPEPYEEHTITVLFNNNSIAGNTEGVIKGNSGIINADFTRNWWGSSSGPGGAGTGTGDSITSGIGFVPWLCSGIDTDIVAPGFQPNLTECPYAFVGFFSPVDNLPTLNVAKAGSGIPVKFSLGGNQGLAILAASSPTSNGIICDTTGPVDSIETVTASNSGLSYDAVTGQYTYVWKTQKAWANTCRQLIITLVDGTTHMANFKFTK
jgi:pectin methylesterase-like acyl-CoA thioesterase